MKDESRFPNGWAPVADGDVSTRPPDGPSPESPERRFEIARSGERARGLGVDHFPAWLDTYTRFGVYGLVGGLVLLVAAFLTNPVPDPSFPWATLPGSFRVPFMQPRIEHWPISYTLAIWLFVFLFPVAFLAGYRRFGTGIRRGAELWLVALPTIAMLIWTTYCRLFWPKLYPPTWNAPAYSFLCWLYCATYNPIWSDVAFGVSTLGVVASLLAWRRSHWASFFLTAFGVLALPLGIPSLYYAFRGNLP